MSRKTQKPPSPTNPSANLLPRYQQSKGNNAPPIYRVKTPRAPSSPSTANNSSSSSLSVPASMSHQPSLPHLLRPSPILKPKPAAHCRHLLTHANASSLLPAPADSRARSSSSSSIGAEPEPDARRRPSDEPRHSQELRNMPPPIRLRINDENVDQNTPRNQHHNGKFQKNNSYNESYAHPDSSQHKFPLFHQVQHDINAYVQKFLFFASKRFWYANEYSATRDMISCRPMTGAQLKEIHQRAYAETILNEQCRCTPKCHMYMIDARIGANKDKVFNGIFGVYQSFVDKNNHISFIHNDKIIHDKLADINVLGAILNPSIKWSEYAVKVHNDVAKELLGPYTTYTMDKFTRLLHKEYKSYSAMMALLNRRSSSSGAGVAQMQTQMSPTRNMNVPQIQLDTPTEDDDNKTPTTPSTPDRDPDAADSSSSPSSSPATSMIQKMKEYHSVLVRDLSADKTQCIERNNVIISGIKSHLVHTTQAHETQTPAYAQQNDTNTESESINKSLQAKASMLKSKEVQKEIAEFVRVANEMITQRNQSYHALKKLHRKLLSAQKKKQKTKTPQQLLSREQSQMAHTLMQQIDTMYAKNKKLVLYGKQLLDYKYECVAYNASMMRLKKEFHAKNKKFKKEIKDRISVIKEFEFNHDTQQKSESKYLSTSAKISSIIRFSKHNMDAGTIQILRTMLENVKHMAPPREFTPPTNDDFALHDEEDDGQSNDDDDDDEQGESEGHVKVDSSTSVTTVEGVHDEAINCAEVYGCNLLHESVVIELEKQVDLCGKLLQKLQEYALKKQKKLHAKMKQIGMLSEDGAEEKQEENELEPHEYHAGDIVFRLNESGEYCPAFLVVIWKTKSYRVYDSELSFQQGRAPPMIDESFRVTDYGYNGHLTVDVKRTLTSNKLSACKGYQFMLARHAFVVKDMLGIKYWRNYIQRGENIRQASQDWKVTHNLNTPKKASLAVPNSNNNNNYADVRDRRSRFTRKTRSSSVI